MELDPKALEAAFEEVSGITIQQATGPLSHAITTYLAAIGETHVLVPKSALDWLNGAGPDENGHWFGDAPDDAPAARAFWWRDKFRRLAAAPPGKGNRRLENSITLDKSQPPV